MDSIIKITQKIDDLVSGGGQEDAKALKSLLSDLNAELNPQDNAATIVKMMQSISKYLIGRTDSPHPEALSLLKSLGSDLETLVGMPAGDSASAREVLDRAIGEFKSLKATISQTSPVSDKEFEELKAVILSVDWEITSHTLKSFDHVLSNLKERVKSNKVHYTFLRIIHSLGGYIARNGAHAEKDSISLLQAVFQDYETLVQNPNMPVADKKALIQSDIRKYNEFKQGLDSGTATVAGESPSTPQEHLPPALSHVGSSSVPEGEATLSLLSETEPSGDSIQALAAKKAPPEQPRDVMGDLFSPKTTPADELLDAIHLAELHGPSAPQSPGDMLAAQAEQQQGEGVKTYTPERKAAEPIPEIESRLDEFFNLDVSENGISELDAEDLSATFQGTEDFPAAMSVEDDEEDVAPSLSGLIETEDDMESSFETDGSIEGLSTLSEEADDEEDIAPSLSNLIESDGDIKPAFETDGSIEGLSTLSEEADSEEDIAPSLSNLIESEDDIKPAFEADEGIEALSTLNEFDTEADDSEEATVPALDFASSAETHGDEGLPLEMIPEDGVEFIEPEEVPELDPALLVESPTDPAEPVLERLKNLLNAPAALGDNGIYTQAQDDIAGLNRIWAGDQDKRTLLTILSGLANYISEFQGAGAETIDKEAHETVEADELQALEAGDSDDGELDPFFGGEDEFDGQDILDPDTAPKPDDEMSTDSEDQVGDDSTSFDDEFQPEEVDDDAPSKKGGFWGKLTARFRK